MFSILVFVIEHGQTTDPLVQFEEEARRQGYEIPECNAGYSTQRVDVDADKVTPEAITAMLDACNPWKVEPIDYAKGMDNTTLAQELIDMGAFDAWLEDTSTLPEFYNRVMREAANA